jgi:pimeloyl-ACP methyl ester carboxylesterase
LPGTAADPVTAVAALTVPVLVMHGTGDGVIPLSHGRALYAAAREPKQWLQVEQGSHLDALAREPVRRRVLDAMDRAVAAR